MKKSFKIVLIIIILIIVTASGGVYYLTRDLSETAEVTLNGINPSNVSDGSYSGSYVSGRWTTTLEVHVDGW
ncbi:MAG: hypothetical protein KMY55_09440 [Dethiosulfatibacter sp.]|nr:hypothetical protein [Dethiosulfatibacter sp.]